MGTHTVPAIQGTLALDTLTGEAPLGKVVVFPQWTDGERELTLIERHILARVAVHCYTHGGRIPFVPPNAYQAKVAQGLAAPSMQLLEPVVALNCQQSYWLTRRGKLVVRRLFKLVSLDEVMRREQTFEFFSALLSHRRR
jgi:hypothetical protein